MKQFPLFSEYTAEEFIKKDGVICDRCGTHFKAQCKTLDDRLVELAYRALKWTFDNNKKTFRIDDITKEHKEICDLQKLHYFGIIKKSDISTRWKITDWGFEFLVGNRKMPRRVWVVNNEEIKRDEEVIRSDEVRKRWQSTKADYTLDFIPLRLSEYKQDNLL